ncbi:MAG: hypothetical protein J0H43_09640 [Actinobacteria bacterium]|nr:hypothetical protein [Actinomycetota bacterium]
MRTRAWLTWASAFIAAGAGVGALLGLPSDEQRQVGPFLLAAAALCLLFASRQLRHLGRGTVRPRVHRPRGGWVGQAIDGPCDGLQFGLPDIPCAPAEVWLAEESPDEHQRHHHRYVLTAVSGDHARYRYAAEQ